MTTDSKQSRSDENHAWGVAGRLAGSHPVLLFLLMTYGWSWFFWLLPIWFTEKDITLMLVITLIGGYGPAIGTILTRRLQDALTLDLSRRRLVVWAVASVVIFGVLTLRYHAGSLPGYDTLPDNAPLSAPVIAGACLVCLTGGWVISSARSAHPGVRKTMASLLPDRLSLPWLGFALGFNAAILLLSWGIGALLGLEIVIPQIWKHSTLKAMYFIGLMFAVMALVRGGIEEPGWRGFMLPELQKKYSPLVASLVIAVFWNLWHIPLHLNGFYPESIVIGMALRSVMVVPLALMTTWLYHKTDGNLLLLVCFHATFNLMWPTLPKSDVIAAALWLIFSVVITLKDKLYRKGAFQVREVAMQESAPTRTKM